MALPKTAKEVEDLVKALEAARDTTKQLTAEQAALAEKGLELDAALDRNKTAYDRMLQSKKRVLALTRSERAEDTGRIKRLEREVEAIKEARDAARTAHAEGKLDLEEAQRNFVKSERERLRVTREVDRVARKEKKEGMDADLKEFIKFAKGSTKEAVGAMTEMVINVSPMLQALSALFPKLSIRKFYDEMATELKTMDATLKGVAKRTGIFTEEMELNMAGAMDPTGAIKDLKVSFEGLRKPLAYVGIVSKDTAVATEALLNNFSLFRPIFVESNQALSMVITNMVAGLKKLGVAEVTSAKLIDQFNKALGKTPQQALDSTMEVTSLAKSLGINLNKAFKDLVSLMPSLAQFGNRTTAVFGQLKAMFVATGIEVNKLNTFAMKMDKWKGAAEAVQRFNAVLGYTAVDVARVWRADPAKKIELFVSAYKKSGRDIHKEHRRFIQEMSEALPAGGDTEFIKRIFGSEKELGLAKERLNVSSMTNEQLEEMVMKSKTSIELLNRAISGQGMGFKKIINETRGYATRAGNQIARSFKHVHSNAKDSKEAAFGIVMAFRSALGLAGKLGIALKPITATLKTALGGAFILGGATGALTDEERSKMTRKERRDYDAGQKAQEALRKRLAKDEASRARREGGPPAGEGYEGGGAGGDTPSITCPDGYNPVDGICVAPAETGAVGPDKQTNIYYAFNLDGKEISKEVIRVVGREFRIERSGA